MARSSRGVQAVHTDRRGSSLDGYRWPSREFPTYAHSPRPTTARISSGSIQLKRWTSIGLIVHFAQEESGIDLSPGGSRHTGLVVTREALPLEPFAMFSELSVAAERSDRFHLLFLE